MWLATLKMVNSAIPALGMTSVMSLQIKNLLIRVGLFFETYILPSIQEHIKRSVQIVSINHAGEKVTLTDAEGRNYQADRVIVTVPLKVLQLKHIEFIPQLPKRMAQAIKSAPVWGGIKKFFWNLMSSFTQPFSPLPTAKPTMDSECIMMLLMVRIPRYLSLGYLPWDARRRDTKGCQVMSSAMRSSELDEILMV